MPDRMRDETGTNAAFRVRDPGRVRIVAHTERISVDMEKRLCEKTWEMGGPAKGRPVGRPCRVKSFLISISAGFSAVLSYIFI